MRHRHTDPTRRRLIVAATLAAAYSFAVVVAVGATVGLSLYALGAPSLTAALLGVAAEVAVLAVPAIRVRLLDGPIDQLADVIGGHR